MDVQYKGSPGENESFVLKATDWEARRDELVKEAEL